MTIPVQRSRKIISGSGWVNPLTHDFPIENASDVQVFADGQQLVMGAHYSVAGVGDPNGYTVAVHDPSAWAPEVWVLDVQYPINQPSDVDQGGQFGQRFEDALDRMARSDQVIWERAQRSVAVSRSTPLDETIELPSSDGVSLLGWSPNNKLVNRPTDGASAAAAEVAAERAQIYGARTFDSLEAMLSNTSLTPADAPVGVTISVRGIGDFEVVSNDEDHTTEGGIKVRAFGGVSRLSSPYVGGDVTDYAVAMSNAVYRAHKDGGGIVDLPKEGTTYLKSPVFMWSDVRLRGSAGRTKLKADADFLLPSGYGDVGVVMTNEFQADRNAWFQPFNQSVEGLHINVGFEGVTVDASFQDFSVSGIHGVLLYGTYHWDMLEICNVWGHGIWTECGEIQSLSSGTVYERLYNGRELHASHLRVSVCGLRGWNHRGPNDLPLETVIISQTDGAGLYQAGGANISAAGIAIKFLHCYSTNKVVTKIDPSRENADTHQVMLYTGHDIEHLYIDSSHKGGVLQAGRGRIGRVYGLLDNQYGAGEHYMVDVATDDGYVGHIYRYNGTRRTGEHGGLLRIVGNRCEAHFLSRETITSEIDWKHVHLEGNSLRVTGQTYGIPAGMTVMGSYSGSQSRIELDFISEGATPSDASFKYDNSGRSGNDLTVALKQGHTGQIVRETFLAATDRVVQIGGSQPTAYEERPVSAASFSLTPNHNRNRVLAANATTATLPAQASNAWVDGTVIEILPDNDLTLTPAAGVSINGAVSLPWTITAGSVARLVRIAIDDWALVGADNIATIVSSSFSLALTHNGRLLTPTASSPSCTLPAQASVAFTGGYRVEISPANTLTLNVASGVTVNGLTAGSWTLAPAPGSSRLIRRGADDWLLTGNATRV